jgi:Bacterial transglutaminase-like cysteine proteinase BTLCP
MIAEVFHEAYDVHGRSTFRPDERRHSHFPSTFPIGRYLSQPLTVECKNLEDLRTFLRKCRYVSDREQFGQPDYWMPPEEFERTRKGDCEDFALYAWRQLLSLGYSARFVGGTSGRYGDGHAWVTFDKDGKTFLLEALACSMGSRLPRLSTLRYKPDISVEWDGEKAHFYRHEDRKFTPPIEQIPGLVLEWLYYRVRLLLRIAYAIPIRLAKKGARKVISRR